MIDVITPREAWIEHDSDILKLVDPSKGFGRTLKHYNKLLPRAFDVFPQALLSFYRVN